MEYRRFGRLGLNIILKNCWMKGREKLLWTS